jgi:peptide/nickel transport system ATP-binding protein
MECDRRRLCIARAIAGEPEFIICDELVSALDISVQAEILNLLKDLQQRRGLTLIFVSHDCESREIHGRDRMAMMSAGKLVEVGPSKNSYAQPNEEYTRRLIDATPSDDLASIWKRVAKRHTM